MSFIYRKFLRSLLFTMESEKIHDLTLKRLGAASRSPTLCRAVRAVYGSPRLPVKAFGLTFPNPVGLAAGMDKKAAAVPIWPSFGFGFSELGGVTALAQPGNRKPRMFRAIDDDALVNRMGFNNPGADAMAETLRGWKESGRWPNHPVGINLGKSKKTPLNEAAGDYLSSFQALREFADFFVVNVSSPNTPNLRKLQDKAALDEILAALQEVNKPPRKKKNQQPADDPATAPRPILVKVAPDLSDHALDEILELTGPRNLAGIVATNTTIARPETSDAKSAKTYQQDGGLSGRPLRERSTEVIKHLSEQTKGELPIIGVGGIFNAEDAWEKIKAGACLVQVYSGLVYEGPSIASEIVKGLKKKHWKRNRYA
ncbi:MAG: dihydroorotate dehydrogenase [Limisphaerales bacterium]|jgi:dihydroorotate dehydrogenase